MKPKTKKDEIKEDKTLSNCILHAIEIESNFKLYSYRIIPPAQFIARTKELLKMVQ